MYRDPRDDAERIRKYIYTAESSLLYYMDFMRCLMFCFQYSIKWQKGKPLESKVSVFSGCVLYSLAPDYVE